MLLFFLSVKHLGLWKTLTFRFTKTPQCDICKLCMIALLIELYPYIPLSVTLTISQGHSN